MMSSVRTAIACAALALCLSTPLASAAGDVPLTVGSAAPPVSEPLESGTFSSAGSGKPYLLELFAVWCPHCQREAAVLNRLQQADGNRIDIIAVPASPLGFDHATALQPSDLRDFAQRFNVNYRIGFDGTFALAQQYGLSSFPTMYFVGTDRHIAAVETGEVPFEELDADVNAVAHGP